MSKSHPMSALAIGLLSAACEPITTSVIELPTRDGSVNDAGTSESDPGDKDGTTNAPRPDPNGCMVLVDQTIPELVTDAAVVASRAVIARTGEAAGCIDADAGGVVFLQASVFSRRDGEPMVERGKRYSYRWPSSVAMAKVNLLGGDEACADETVVSVQHGLLFSAKGFASCYEFRSPIDAHYLRTTAADYLSPIPWLSLGKAPPELLLCPAPCPEGTQADLDAGTDSGVALDGGHAIPGVP